MIPLTNPDDNEVRGPTCWGIIDDCLRCGGIGTIFVEDLTEEEISGAQDGEDK